MDLEKFPEQHSPFNRDTRELTLVQIRALSSDEFYAVGSTLPPQFWCLASKKQLAGLDFGRISREQLENLIRGDGTVEEFCQRFQVLSQQQMEVLIVRASPELYKDLRNLFSS